MKNKKISSSYVNTFLALVLFLSMLLCGCNNSSTQQPETSGDIDITEKDNSDTKEITEPSNEGIWVTKNYVDEFGDETVSKYVTTKDYLSGTFSNTATTDSKLNARIFVDATHISIFLYEYGNQQVKSNIFSGYKILVKYGYNKIEVSGKLNTDRIIVNTYNYEYKDKVNDEIIKALSSGNTVYFYLEESERPTDTYSFSVESSNFLSEYAKSIDDSVLNIYDTNYEIDAYTPQTEEEQKYYDAQLLAFKYDYAGAYKLLEEIKGYKHATEALELLSDPLCAVFKFNDDVSTHYLWIRAEIFFDAMSSVDDYETPFLTYSAYKWIEYPSTGDHLDPVKLSQTSKIHEPDLIMNYSYKWDISGDIVYETEIDQNGNDLGELSHQTWTRLDSDEEVQAIGRVKEYIKNG